ncbi:MAG TPA: carboxypeptidase regulatory-like domain-containing protein, partial [bacterium]|nr:carboxypeptidase regulatory-like domain-containing protein [bacterium]
MIASARTVFAFLLAAGSFAAAQQRRPLLGRVVDADGNRLANVTVNCALTPPGERRNRAIENLTGTTDERGRFRFQVYPCTTYRLWAIGAAGEDGKRATSALQSAAAGAPFELRATEHIPAISLTVSGVKEWLDRWPLKLRLAPRGIEVPGKALPLADDGTCALPPLPLGRTAIDILDKDDNPIYSISVSSGGSQLKITLPPPCEVPMRVVDSNGKPVAGARIRQRLAGGWFGSDGLTVGVPARELWRDLGRTDADGRLAARISYRHDPFQNTNWQRLLFLADKDGYTVSHSGFTDNPYIDGKEVEREGLEELRFTLQPSRPFTGRILVGDDAGLANQPVI